MVRSLASKRSDGLLTAEQLRRSIGCPAAALDAVLRELERAGSIAAAPTVGRVVIVILVDDPPGDDRALRRVRVDDFARYEQERRGAESLPEERAGELPGGGAGATEPPRGEGTDDGDIR
jgi:hypothetical protein